MVHLVRSADGAPRVVKTLLPELARNVSVRRMFVAEARIAERIESPHVARVTASGYDKKGRPWIEMEWVRGGSLHALEQAGPLDDRLFATVLADVLAALSAAHHARAEDGGPLEVVHRDVSPHNVVVGVDGVARLVDFGIAKVAGEGHETSTGLVKGKARYLAPEQAAREPVGPRADVFAVGVMLHQQLSGRRMWEGLTEPEIFHRLVRGEIPDPALVVPAPNPALVALTKAMTARAPEDRPDAGSARAALLGAFAVTPDDRAALGALVARVFHEDLADLDAGLARASAEPPPRVSAPPKTGERRGKTGARVALGAFVVVAVLGGYAAARRFGATRDPAPAAVLVPPAPRCTSDGACGPLARCTDDGACLALEYEGCAVPDVGADREKRAFYIGTLFPLSGKDGEAFGRSNERGAELAAREVNLLAGGIPTESGARPIAIVACDDADHARERAELLSTHVTAVIGFRTSDEALALTRDLLVPRGLLVVSALNASPLLSQLPAGHPRRFYRVAANATALAGPFATATRGALAKEARRRFRLGAGLPRIAVVREGNATGIAYADKVLRALEGAPLVVKEIALGGAGDQVTRKVAVDTLVSLAPHVVLVLGDDMTTAVVDPVDARLPAAQRPLYFASTPWEGPAVAAGLARDPSRRERLFAVSWPIGRRSLLGFVERMREATGEVLTPATASPGPYDAVYLLAYAAAAARVPRLDGAALAAAIPRLLPAAGARTVPVGPADVVAGLALAGRGEPIDLDGVSSRFDFASGTADSPVDAVLLRTTFDEKKGLVDACEIPIDGDAIDCPRVR